MVSPESRNPGSHSIPEEAGLVVHDSLADGMPACGEFQHIMLSISEMVNADQLFWSVTDMAVQGGPQGAAHISQRSVEPSTSDTTMVISLSTRPSPFPAPRGSVPGGFLHAKTALQEMEANMLLIILVASKRITSKLIKLQVVLFFMAVALESLGLPASLSQEYACLL